LYQERASSHQSRGRSLAFLPTTNLEEARDDVLDHLVGPLAIENVAERLGAHLRRAGGQDVDDAQEVEGEKRSWG
jgi:hypothetical protein